MAWDNSSSPSWHDANSLAHDVSNFRIGIVYANWHRQVIEPLVKASLRTLAEHKIPAAHIIQQSVPGSFEIPLAAKHLLQQGTVDAVVCLGCIVQGDTPHFDYVCQGVTQGIMQLTLEYTAPIGFGLLTVNNLQQAMERAGGKLGNHGENATLSVLHMLSMLTLHKKNA